MIAGFDGEGFVYVDGDLQARAPVIGEMLSGNGVMRIGYGRPKLPNGYGKIDDVVFYDRALTADEVNQIYCAQGGNC